MFSDKVTEPVKEYANSIVKRISPSKGTPIIADFELLDEVLQRVDLKQSGQKLNTASVICDAKLFRCSATTGAVKIENVPQFIQEDLDNNSVMILDIVQKVYVWLGKKSRPNEQKVAIETMMVLFD